LEYFTLLKFQAKAGSKMWNRVGTSWRLLSKDITRMRPQSFEEVMSEPLWWSNFSTLIGPGFSKARATQLHQAGLRRLSDAWRDGALLSAAAVQAQFGLRDNESGTWDPAIDMLNRTWASLLRGINPLPDPKEWLGIFSDHPNELPLAIFQAGHGDSLRVSPELKRWWLPFHLTIFTVLPASRSLVEARPPIGLGANGARGTALFGKLARVRIVDLVRGPKKVSMRLFYGETQSLAWLLAKFNWPNQLPARDYCRGARAGAQP
jgi:hypothetical protein